MLLPFAFVFIGLFIVLSIFFLVRKAQGKKELRKDVEQRDEQLQKDRPDADTFPSEKPDNEPHKGNPTKNGKKRDHPGVTGDDVRPRQPDKQ